MGAIYLHTDTGSPIQDSPLVLHPSLETSQHSVAISLMDHFVGPHLLPGQPSISTLCENPLPDVKTSLTSVKSCILPIPILLVSVLGTGTYEGSDHSLQ